MNNWYIAPFYLNQMYQNLLRLNKSSRHVFPVIELRERIGLQQIPIQVKLALNSLF
jgi:hypothetical protein